MMNVKDIKVEKLGQFISFQIFGKERTLKQELEKNKLRHLVDRTSFCCFYNEGYK